LAPDSDVLTVGRTASCGSAGTEEQVRAALT
jgi:hypothetical protein